MGYNEDGVYIFSKEEVATALANGIPFHILYSRVNNSCWTIERAITEPVNRRSCSKKYTQEEKEIAESNGLDMRLVCIRINRGWSRKDAITIPRKKRTQEYKRRERKGEKIERC